MAAPTTPDKLENTSDAVAFDEIYEQKENIQPLSTGRSAKKLHSIFTTDRKTLEEELKEGHGQFNKELEGTDELEDPLDVHHRYIRWTISSYPAGPSHASYLVPLLERTSREFVNDRRYANDIRYLRLWILYSKYVDTPTDIFSFLASNEIGTNHALFYEEWAYSEKQNRNFKDADSIFSLGIVRKAEPLARLKKTHEAFQAQMLLPQNTEPATDGGNLNAGDSASAPLVRPALNGIGNSGNQGLQNNADSMSSNSRKNNNAKGFAVFNDAEGQLDDERQQSRWQDFGTIASRKAENNREATAWKGEKLKLSSSHSKPEKQNKLQVFRDESAEEGPPIKTNTIASDAFTTQNEAHRSETELLRSNPFKNFKGKIRVDKFDFSKSVTAAAVGDKGNKCSSHPDPSRGSAKSEHHKREKSVPRSSTRVAVPLTEIYPNNDTEVSLEEIIVRRRNFFQNCTDVDWVSDVKNSGEWHHVDSTGKPIFYHPETGAPCFEYLRKRQEYNQKEEALEKQNLEQLTCTETEEPIQTCPPSKTSSKNQSSAPPSPTINTKAAMAEVNEMFAKTMRLDKSPGDSDDVEASSESQEEQGDFGAESNNEQVDDTFWGTPATQSESEENGRLQGEGDMATDDERISIHANDMQPVNNSAVEEAEETSGVDSVVEEAPVVHSDESKKASVPFRPSKSSIPKPNRFSRRSLSSTSSGAVRENNEQQGRTLRAGRTTTGKGLDEADSPGKEEVPDGETMSSQNDSNLDVPPQTPGQDSDRRHMRGPNRFAQMIDAMTPITERTGDLTSLTNAFGGGRKSSILQRIDSDDDEAFIGGENTEYLQEDEQDNEKYEVESGIGSIQDQFDQVAIQRGRPEPCNPYDAELVNRMLKDSSKELNRIPSFHDKRNVELGQSQGILADAKKLSRQSLGSSKRKDSDIHGDSVFVGLDGNKFKLAAMLGEGGFASVFRAVDLQSLDDERATPDCAMKIERPCNVWEFFVLDQLRTRASERTVSSIVKQYSEFAFADESYLILEYSDMGTLLTAANKAFASGPGIDETVAIFFMIELLRTVEGFHEAQIIHGDLKPDNCLIRLQEIPEDAEWIRSYKRDGSGGWAYKGIKIIDFGRSIDLSRFPNGQQFLAKWTADENDCIEMRQGRPWSYEADYFGLAAIAHVLLFGKFLNAQKADTERGPKQVIGQTFKRYNQAALWEPLFDMLLNPGTARSDRSLPITRELSGIRHQMEDWLEVNSDKNGKSLKSLLKKVEIAATE